MIRSPAANTVAPDRSTEPVNPTTISVAFVNTVALVASRTKNVFPPCWNQLIRVAFVAPAPAPAVEEDLPF